MKNIAWFRKYQLPINIIFFLALFVGIFQKYVLNVNSSFFLEGDNRISLGISIVQQDASTFNTESQDFFQESNRTTSFLLQPQSTFAQVYLDYVAIYDDASAPKELSIKSVYISTNSELVPSELVLEKSPENLTYDSNEYKYAFNSQEMARGKRYIMPHILLGIVPVRSSANIFKLIEIQGNRSDLFPFDEQKIELNITFDGTFDGQEVSRFSPTLEVVVAQQGWIGSFEKNNSGGESLHLQRYPFYKIVLLIFLLVMIPITLLLNNVIDESSGFFEVAFGLLLGLWGMHEILVPVYVHSSALIDFIIYILYVLVIGEILFEVLKGWYIHYAIKVRIKEINAKDEYVIIVNNGWLNVDMTGWMLFDNAGNTFKFPSHILRIKSTVKIWTETGIDDTTNLYWNRRKHVWDDKGDVAYLKNDKDVLVHEYRYP